jgi:hypothetical protein
MIESSERCKRGITNMINREDMLELTRRMTVRRNSIDRIAGCYLDQEGEVDGTFNVNFLNLSAKDKESNLAIAKTIPFSETNVQLKDYKFSRENERAGSMWQLLTALKECGLKNDDLMDCFYEQVMKVYPAEEEYAILMFHGRYDVPVKTSDHVSQWESEEVYEYLICAISPLQGEYEPGMPECGFLFPAFCDRSGDVHRINIFQKTAGDGKREAMERLLFL